MMARVATFPSPPPSDNRWVLEILESSPGCVCCYHIYDAERDIGVSVSVYDDEQSLQAAETAVTARAREIEWQAPPPDEVRTYEVKGYVERR